MRDMNGNKVKNKNMETIQSQKMRSEMVKFHGENLKLTEKMYSLVEQYTVEKEKGLSGTLAAEDLQKQMWDVCIEALKNVHSRVMVLERRIHEALGYMLDKKASDKIMHNVQLLLMGEDK